MKHLFIPYELALRALKLNFNEPCLATYYKKELSQYPYFREEETGFIATVKNSQVVGLIADTIAAPLYQQVIDWLRDKNLKIIEGEQYGWLLLTKQKEDWSIEDEFDNANKAIEQAFELITK